MHLQSLHNGCVYGTVGRTVYRETAKPEGTLATSGLVFDSLGTLPVVGTGLPGLATRLQTAAPWKRVLEAVVGTHRTVNLWVVSPSVMLSTAGRHVFVSEDGGRNWSATLSLPASSGRMGVLPSGVCRHGEDIYLAEYPLGMDATPQVHLSTDDGWSWESYLTLPDVRHVHSVSADPYSGDCWVTTGDTDEACQLIRLRDGDAHVVGGGSQEWRIVEPAFTRDAIVWGVDCAYADENRIYKLPRDQLDTAIPTPERVGALSSSAYYAETLAVGDTEWVVLSTAAERGGDRTAPDERPAPDTAATVVAASSKSGFTDWTTLATYRPRTVLADWPGSPSWLPAANTYVFLASSPDHGLFLNPCNTATDDGDIRRVPNETFRELSGCDACRVDLN